MSEHDGIDGEVIESFAQDVAPGPDQDAELAQMVGDALPKGESAGNGASTSGAATSSGPKSRGAGLGIAVAVVGIAAAAGFFLWGGGMPEGNSSSPAEVADAEAAEKDGDAEATKDGVPNAKRAAELAAAGLPEGTPEGPPPAHTLPVTSDPAQLVANAKKAAQAGDIAKADKIYRQLSREHRGTSHEVLARVNYGYLLLDAMNRPKRAVSRFDAYLRDDGEGARAEEALLGRAKAQERIGDAAATTEAWKQLVARFPDSEHAKSAASRIEALAKK